MIAVEQQGTEGPTGKLLLVTEARVVDYGGNLLGSGQTAEEVRAITRKHWRTPTKVVALKTAGELLPGDRAELLCHY